MTETPIYDELVREWLHDKGVDLPQDLTSLRKISIEEHVDCLSPPSTEVQT